MDLTREMSNLYDFPFGERNEDACEASDEARFTPTDVRFPPTTLNAKRIVDGLVVFGIHGMDGDARDFRQFDVALHQLFPTLTGQLLDAPVYLRSLRSNVNKDKTSDGVQRLGRRVAREIISNMYMFPEGILGRDPTTTDETVKSTLYRVRIAMVGHSMGGLIARNAIRYLLLGSDRKIDMDLYQPVPYDYNLDEWDAPVGQGWPAEWTFDGFEKKMLEERGIHLQVTPMSFISVSSPHLGIRRSKLVTNLSVNNALRVASTQIARTKFKLTGKELLLRDKSQILAQMNDDQGPWQSAMKKFPLRTLIASVVNDIVPFCSAEIRSYNPYIQDHEVMLKRIEGPGAKILSHVGFDNLYQEHLFNETGQSVLEETDAIGLRHPEGEAWPEGKLTIKRSSSRTRSKSPNLPKDSLAKEVFRRASPSPMPDTPVVGDFSDKPMDLLSDSHNTLEFSSSQMMSLQRIAYRRISCRLEYPSHSVFALACTHPHMIGVQTAAVPKDVQAVGECMAAFVAKLVILDFCSAIKQM
jgi:hypothetical protein